MKKFLIAFLIISMLFCFGACGEEQSNSEGIDIIEYDADGNKIEKTEETTKNNVFNIVTVETLKNASASDERLFEVVDVDGGVSINAYIGDETIVVIPEEINGKPVVEVDDGAFIDVDTIRGVRLADSIKVIGDEAFNLCDNLEVFVCGSGLEEIGETCFFSCPRIKEIILNDGLKVIKMAAIFAGENMTELYVPSSVTTIDGGISTQSDLTIICEKGSVAEQYAIDEGINYEYK